MMQQLHRKINWRHILVHLLAIYSFQQAAYQWAFLTDTTLLDAMRYNGVGYPILTAEEVARRSLDLMKAAGVFSGVGLLAGFVCSLVISISRKWSWLNSILAFVILLALSNLLLHTGMLSFLWVPSPGSVLGSSFLRHFVDGLLLLSAAMLLFFSNRVNRFIKGREQVRNFGTFQFEEEMN
jgi:hypothetical protein